MYSTDGLSFTKKKDWKRHHLFALNKKTCKAQTKQVSIMI